VQAHPLAVDVGLEAEALQRVADGRAVGAQVAADLAAAPVGALHGGVVGVARVGGDGLGQDLGDQVVAALRDGDRHAVADRLVQLRRAAAPARLVGWRLVARGEQARVDELVEVEGGEAARHAGALGRLLAPDGPLLAADELVQRPPRAVDERRDRRKTVCHGSENITNAHC
jgi:hypothetical protein